MYKHYPLFRPFASYVSGVVISYYALTHFKVAFNIAKVLIFLLIALFLLMWVSHLLTFYRTRLLFGIFCLAAFFTLGFENMLLNCQSEYYNFEGVNEKKVYRAYIDAPPVFSEKSLRVVANLTHYKSDSVFIPIREKCSLSMEREKESENLDYGDVIIFVAKMKNVSFPQNEEEFNYRNYLSRRKIYRQAYLSSDSWKRTDENEGNTLIRRISLWRSSLIKKIKGSHLDLNVKGIVCTMLLGDDVLIDSELSEIYATAGVSHILCVSGMHVGIIYFIMNYLLSFLNFSNWQRALKTVLLLIFIWFYAFIVALTPSVVRSAVMFTFVSIGGLMKQQTLTYNSLITAAMFMTVLNPCLLFEVGFQMSYLAVFGIVWTQPVLKSIIKTKCKLYDYIWNIWTVSIAAQLFTSPISISCFHKFPTYFLFSNVVVVVLAPFVIAAGIAFLVFSFNSFLEICTTRVLNLLVNTMNTGVCFFESLPGSNLENLYMSPLQIPILYMFIIFLFSFFKRFKVANLFRAMICLLFFLSVSTVREANNHFRREITVYAIPHHYVVEDCQNGKNLIFTDDYQLFTDGKFDFQIANYRIKQGRKYKFQQYSCEKSENFVLKENYFQTAKSFYVLDKKIYPEKMSFSEKFPDYLILCDSTSYSIKNALKVLNPREVLILPGIPAYKTQNWKTECENAGINAVDMSCTGMLKIKY